MNAPADLPALVARSERLDAYLAQDAANEHLLADAFDAAVAANRLEAAERHVASGLAGGESKAWKFRQATLAIAQDQLPKALALLQSLADDSPHPAVRFNLGYVHFRLGAYESSAALLEPLLEEQPAAQAIWLRSLHQLGHVERAWSWVEVSLTAGRLLEAEVCGVASLVALDADHVEAAEQLADRALQRLPEQREALVAKGSAALGRRDAATAARIATAVLAQRTDGRAQSLRGFARLLAQDLPSALADMEKAVVLMPGHIGTWQGLGWTRLLLNDLRGAERAFAEALALDRNFAESHGSYAVALVMAGRATEAGPHIERARRLDPGSMAAQYAELLLSGKGADRAAIEKLAGQLLRSGPGRAKPQVLPGEGPMSS